MLLREGVLDAEFGGLLWLLAEAGVPITVASPDDPTGRAGEPPGEAEQPPAERLRGDDAFRRLANAGADGIARPGIHSTRRKGIACLGSVCQPMPSAVS